MPHNLRDQLTNMLSRLEQGSMIVVEYDACFHKLASHAASILAMEFERVHCFVRGLRLPIRMSI